MTEGVGSPVNTQDKVVLAPGTSNTAGGSSELTVGGIYMHVTCMCQGGHMSSCVCDLQWTYDVSCGRQSFIEGRC